MSLYSQRSILEFGQFLLAFDKDSFKILNINLADPLTESGLFSDANNLVGFNKNYLSADNACVLMLGGAEGYSSISTLFADQTGYHLLF